MGCHALLRGVPDPGTRSHISCIGRGGFFSGPPGKPTTGIHSAFAKAKASTTLRETEAFGLQKKSVLGLGALLTPTLGGYTGPPSSLTLRRRV